MIEPAGTFREYAMYSWRVTSPGGASVVCQTARYVVSSGGDSWVMR